MGNINFFITQKYIYLIYLNKKNIFGGNYPIS